MSIFDFFKNKSKPVKTENELLTEKMLQLDIFETRFEHFIIAVGTSGKYSLNTQLEKCLGFNPSHLNDYLMMINRGHAIGKKTIRERLAHYLGFYDINFNDADSYYTEIFNFEKRGHRVNSIYIAVNNFALDLAYGFEHDDIRRATWMKHYSEEELKSGFWSNTLSNWNNVGEYLDTNGHGFGRG